MERFHFLVTITFIDQETVLGDYIITMKTI